MQRAIADEDKKMLKLRLIVDSAAYKLRHWQGTEAEAIEFIAATKGKVLELFPDKEKPFDLIYLPRFSRILRERAERSLRGA